LFFNEEQSNIILYLSIYKLTNVERDDLFVLSFSEIELSDELASHQGVILQGNVTKEQLQKEVEIFRERLQSSISDLEVANEELQSTNEELQSANEELQSANEELQTANEELQSTNEELSTVNEELEVKTFELAQVNNDLESMLFDIDEMIVFIDNRLRLKRYTNKAGKQFGLQRSDIGQVVTSFDLAHDIANFRNELLNVIENESQSVLPMRMFNQAFNLRLVAYKADEKEVVGVILFFEKQAKDSRDECDVDCLSQIFQESIQLPYLIIDKSHSIQQISPGFEGCFNIRKNQLLNHNMLDFIVHKAHHQDDFFDNFQGMADDQGWMGIAVQFDSLKPIVIKMKVLKVGKEGLEYLMLFNPDM